MATFPVSVEVDHLARLAGQPLNGLAELIWNALDADADTVRVAFERNEIGGIAAIRVVDDGHGMTYEQARTDFTHLGGSWKRTGLSRTRSRPLHGRGGQGRWRAFGVPATRIVWESVADVDGETQLTTIEISKESLGAVEIEGPTPTDRSIGTTVVLDGITQPPAGLDAAGAPERLTALFALHIQKYRTSIEYDHSVLDPGPLMADKVDVALGRPDGQDATLIIIEWKPAFERGLYLCDPDGIALEEIPVGIHAPGFHFTAYVLWEGFVQHADELGLANLGNPHFDPVITLARDALRDHFRRKADDRARRVIDEWKQEQVYPYAEAPSTVVEETRRGLFDLVAIQAASAVNAGEDPRAKRLSLQLLREAVDAGPAALRRVLNEVLDLPKARLSELNELLDRTSLDAIIGAAKVIADRLDFLKGLEHILFDPANRRTLKERSQLHKILNRETWIFGEEFALSASDQSLTEVLRQHVALLGREYVALDEDDGDDRQVLDAGGHRRIVDLMLSRAMEHRRNRREHLVVELKAPSVRLGLSELSQIENYAFAVAEDPRFNAIEVQWDFIVVSNELDENARHRANQRDRPPGLIYEGEAQSVRVWARPWAEILEECRHRLKFVEAQLQYAATTEHGIEYLQREHLAFLPDSLRVTADGVEAPEE